MDSARRYDAQRMRRFLEPRDDREAVREDVERWVGRPLAEKARATEDLCSMVAEALAARADRERVLAQQEPPAEDYLALVRRSLRRSRRRQVDVP
jgi:hypothetical protein